MGLDEHLFLRYYPSITNNYHQSPQKLRLRLLTLYVTKDTFFRTIIIGQNQALYAQQIRTSPPSFSDWSTYLMAPDAMQSRRRKRGRKRSVIRVITGCCTEALCRVRACRAEFPGNGRGRTTHLLRRGGWTPRTDLSTRFERG